jgi:quercetin dioxygenase-like cupin family protein
MPANPKVVTPGSGKLLRFLDEVVTTVLAGADTGGTYAIVQVTTPPGGGPPLHRHSREDETHLVLEGEYDIWVGEHTVRAAGPGTLFVAPRGVAHTFKCIGRSPGKIQVIMSPPGFEGFFEEVGALAGRGPIDMDQIIDVATRYGLELVRPSSA